MRDLFGEDDIAAIESCHVQNLEDLFVRPQFRRRGIGKRLLAATARIAGDNNCHGMRWEVLDWNHPAVEFYKSLGAEFLDEWRLVLLKDDALQRLAEIT